MGAAVWRNFSNRGPQAGTDGEEAAGGGRCEGGPAVGPGRYTVQRKCEAAERAAAGGNRYTVQRGMSRTAVRWGPRFCSTAPGQDPPTPPPADFPVGRPLGGDECRADVRWVRAEPRRSIRADRRFAGREF